MKTLLALVALLALSSAGSAGAAGGAATLYANYNVQCVFQFVGDSGAPVTSIAPGNYQLVVETPFEFGDGLSYSACSEVQFRLTGPGVAFTTTLGGGERPIEQLTITLQPGATYVAQDDQAPGQTRVSFTTTASGAPVAATPSGGASTSSSGAGTKAGGTSTSVSGIGSTVKSAPLGTLVATVSPTGALTLTEAAGPVTKLAAGRYVIQIDDRSAKDGFLVQPANRVSRALSTAVFTGTRKVTLTLTAGSWFYYSSFVGTKHTFSVA